ncbi:MAG: HAMP domain-containing sensor histidine kinase [Isosphaeraceae bacterium]
MRIRWTIRIKLIAGLSLVIGMMLTLMIGSIYGLQAFHRSNMTLVDLLPELGASKELMQRVVRLDGIQDQADLARKTEMAREALSQYYKVFDDNKVRGNRAFDGRNELKLAFLIDFHLAALLAEVQPDVPIQLVLKRSEYYFDNHPDEVPGHLLPRAERINNLNKLVVELPNVLHRDFFTVLQDSKSRYHYTRWIVWISAIAVLIMLGLLMVLFQRWVLHPVRLLQRGVRRVAGGSFDYKIELRTGDEMERLAEAFNDMTNRLSATYSDLEAKVQDRSRQLVRSERLAGVGFLAAGVAHEINNPLASIAFCSEALENRVAPLMEKTDPAGEAKIVRNYLRMIQEEAFRCKAITEKLLDFSRCGEIQRQRTDLGELIQSVVEMIRHLGKYRGKQIVFQPREAVWCEVDAQEIKQVVLNLVVNALDCMEVGGTLKIEIRHHGGMAEMTFADDGCGMPPEVLENIFEPFFTRRKGGKGTGLGLSITHRIVSQHHGEISATSPGEGRGSTFHVRIPNRAGSDDSGEIPRPRAGSPRAA